MSVEEAILDVDESLVKIREYAKAGKLQAQQKGTYELCQYGGENPCAIGCLLTKEQAAAADKEKAALDTIMDIGLVVFTKDGEETGYDNTGDMDGDFIMFRIQEAHDEWVKTKDGEETSRYDAYKRFCQLIGLDQSDVPFQVDE